MLPLVLSSDSHVFEPPAPWQTRIDALIRMMLRKGKNPYDAR